MGRPDHAAGCAKPDQSLQRGRTPARCGARPQNPRCGALGDRPAQPRWCGGCAGPALSFHFAAIIPSERIRRRKRRQGMLARLFSTLVKVAVASLIVGTVLAHFGITADQVLKDMGLTPERVAELARQGLSWALPNLLLGSLIIVPVWLVVFLFR